MRLTSKKIIALLLLLVCAQALIIAGLDELLGTTGDLIGFIPIFGLASKPEKDH